MSKLLANIVLLIQGRVFGIYSKKAEPAHHCRVSAKQSIFHLLLCFLLSCFSIGAIAVELDFYGAEYLVVQAEQKDNAKTTRSIEQTELSVAEASEHSVTPEEWLVQYISPYLYQSRIGVSMTDNTAFYQSYAVEQTVLLDGLTWSSISLQPS